MFTYKIVQEAKQADITISWVILHYRFVWFGFLLVLVWAFFFFLFILYSSSTASTKCFVNTLVDVALKSLRL